MHTLVLSVEEHDVLEIVLKNYERELHAEIRRTDLRSFKDGLKEEERVLRGIVARLATAAA